MCILDAMLCRCVLRIIFRFGGISNFNLIEKCVYFYMIILLLVTALCPRKKHRTYKYRWYRVHILCRRRKKNGTLAIQSNITCYSKQFPLSNGHFFSILWAEISSVLHWRPQRRWLWRRRRRRRSSAFCLGFIIIISNVLNRHICISHFAFSQMMIISRCDGESSLWL